MIKRIKSVHEKNHIHRDIKPDNFMMGAHDNENNLYIIDFGLSKKYRSSTKKGHIPFKNHKNITGTARYCSINTHKGYEQSRRDDLESIGYVLMYFLRGSLPWQGLKIRPDEDHYQKIFEKKKSTSIQDLCKGFPSKFFIILDEFCDYFEYVVGLSFTADPDYDYLKNLFISIINNHCQKIKHDFDWNNKLKSTAQEEIDNYNFQEKNSKVNISLVNNNNISQNSFLNDNSQLNLVKDDINNMSIFKDNNKEAQNNEKYYIINFSFEPSIFDEKENQNNNHEKKENQNEKTKDVQIHNRNSKINSGGDPKKTKINCTCCIF